MLAAVIVIHDAKASNVYGNFGGCTATPNPGWDCRGDAPAGGRGDGNHYAYAVTQRGAFPFSTPNGVADCTAPYSQPVAGLIPTNTSQVSAIFEPLGTLPTTGRYHIDVALYYWLGSQVTAGGHTSRCLDTQIRVEYLNGAFSPAGAATHEDTCPVSSYGSACNFIMGASGGGAFQWVQVGLGSVTANQFSTLKATVSTQAVSDMNAWGIPSSTGYTLSGIEIAVEGYGFTTSVIDVKWGEQAILSACHVSKGDVAGFSGHEDGLINILDMANVALQFGRNVGDQSYTGPLADITQDGTVSILDVSLAANWFGQTC
ncbi:MAG: hypothetical protein AUJ07_11840 [Crenarchaeota archaeon 13_1_40CM_3_53_5]|nr:MAG: hypothetical protein AUJ07_11840 [Crenarchaeota archaeon 13_1_40CM_3_53_5]